MRIKTILTKKNRPASGAKQNKSARTSSQDSTVENGHSNDYVVYDDYGAYAYIPDSLSGEMAAFIVREYLLGKKTFDQISQELGMTVDIVKKIYKNAVDTLRHYLDYGERG